MGKRQAIKNIKRVSCRFDMDIPEERRTWQILQGNYQEPPDGKKQDYTSIIAKAMIGHKCGEGCIKANPHRISRKGNIFVSMPDYKTGCLDDNGKDIFQDIAYPVTRQFWQELYDEIVKEYQSVMRKKVGVEPSLAL